MVGILSVQPICSQRPSVIRVSPCVFHIAISHVAPHLEGHKGKTCEIPRYKNCSWMGQPQLKLLEFVLVYV